MTLYFSRLLTSGRANFEPYGIALLTLTFEQKDEEEKYQSSVLSQAIEHVRFAIVFALILIAIYATVDPFVYKDVRSLAYAYAVRLLIIALGIFFIYFSFHETYVRYSQPLGTSLISVVGVCWLLLAYRTHMEVLVYTFPALMMTSIYSFFFSGLLFRNGFVAGCIFNSAYSFAIWSSDISTAIAIGVNIQIFVAFLLLAMAAYQKELISRQLFVSEARERKALVRQYQIDSHHLEWLRQLANFLKHEVRQPIAQISSSIELIRLIVTSNDRFMPHVTTASQGVRDVWNLVERASRATDAEAFVRQAQLKSVDLAELLTDLVATCQQTYSGVEFRLQILIGARVNADPLLIREAVNNLLANAASFVEGHNTVDVIMERSGPNAIIKVRNKGPLVLGDPQSLFGPFASTRSGPLSEHQGLGLYLVRLIAEHHGGQATLSNLNDQSGVEASISLPLFRQLAQFRAAE
jgi:signal transduction histidine kinase